MLEFYQTPYEGYKVSKCGIIVSYRIPGGGFDYSRKPRYLSYKTDRDGYLEVLLSVDSKRYYKKVHQIVAETFLEKEDSSLVVDHIDANRKNNHVDNLRYITVRLNTQRGRVGIKPSIAKIVDLKVGDSTERFYSIKDAMASIGKSPSAYYRMKSGNIGSRFEYEVISFREGVETIEISLARK